MDVYWNCQSSGCKKEIYFGLRPELTGGGGGGCPCFDGSYKEIKTLSWV